MTPAVTHPLISAWLRDLELLLHGVDPGERAEVLAGVHEHLEASLPPSASDDDVRRTLAELGSPQSVADEAYAGRPAHAPVAPSRAQASPWTAQVACFLNAAGLALLAVLTLLTGLGSTSMAPHLSELAFLATAFALPWLLVVALTSMSEVWGSADKLRSILIYPVTLVALGVVTWAVGLAGIRVLTIVAALLVVAAGARTLSRLIGSTRAAAFGRR